MSQCLCCDKRDAGYRYACDHCVNDMRRWLRDMEDYATILLGWQLGRLRDQTIGSIGVAFGPRIPMDIAVATTLDPRSIGGGALMREHDPHVDDIEPIRSLPSSIHGIAAWIREERDESEPRSWTLVSELRYLRGEIAGCAIEQWVNELHDDLSELHRHARQLASDTPRPLSKCLSVDCGGMVFWDIREENGKRLDQAKCANEECRRVYTGTDLVRLGVAQEAG